jgi:hypothetical protein
MIYCPTVQDYKQLKRLLMPVPPMLLEHLEARGLGIWVLKGDIKSSEFLYNTLGREMKLCHPDTRYPHQAPHYHMYSKQIVVTKANLYAKCYNILLHELGHAVDFLMSYTAEPLSDSPAVAKVLRRTRHLNKYTKEMDTERNQLAEHFATCFSAYLSEPVNEFKRGYHSIDELHPRTREYFQRGIFSYLG